MLRVEHISLLHGNVAFDFRFRVINDCLLFNSSAKFSIFYAAKSVRIRAHLGNEGSVVEENVLNIEVAHLCLVKWCDSEHGQKPRHTRLEEKLGLSVQLYRVLDLAHVSLVELSTHNLHLC